MADKSYSDKLKDPRWQKLRLKILERDEWACRNCFDSESTLHVHHSFYLKDKEPWEYPECLLITLCEDCHEEEYNEGKKFENALIEVLRRKGCMWFDFESLMLDINESTFHGTTSYVLSAIGYHLKNSNLQMIMMENYANYLSEKKKSG